MNWKRGIIIIMPVWYYCREEIMSIYVYHWKQSVWVDLGRSCPKWLSRSCLQVRWLGEDPLSIHISSKKHPGGGEEKRWKGEARSHVAGPISLEPFPARFSRKPKGASNQKDTPCPFVAMCRRVPQLLRTHRVGARRITRLKMQAAHRVGQAGGRPIFHFPCHSQYTSQML